MNDLVPQNSEKAPAPPPRQAPKLDARSLTEASKQCLETHLRPDHRGTAEAYLLNRIPKVLALFYQMPMTAEDRVGVIREFVGLLRVYPVWLIARACDQWVARNKNAPTPHSLKTIIEVERLPIVQEINRRKKYAQERDAENRQRERDRPDPEAAARIMHEAGFTSQRLALVAAGTHNRMARALDELGVLPATARGHWSDEAPPDDPRWEELRRAREAVRDAAAKRAAPPEKGRDET